MANVIQVDLVYAADEIFSKTLQLQEGTTIREAIDISGVLLQCPEIQLGRNQVGIFGKRKKLDTILQDDDRIEIYRPLKIEPMEARRRRAEKNA